MIYSSYKDVLSEWEYASKWIKSTKERAISYLTDVVKEVGTLTITLCDEPSLLSNYDGNIVLFKTISKYTILGALDVRMLLEICEQVHSLHLVKEWGEPDEEQSNTEERQ